MAANSKSRNLRDFLLKMPPAEQRGATGMYGDDPENELRYMPEQLLNMYMADNSDHY